jgi:carbon-monoxide dehydrogenase medium subunit
MIPATFEYARATSIEDAVAKLAAAQGAGKIIAGGHSLVPVMKMRLAQPSTLIDISRIAALTGIREEGGRVHIGACTAHHDIAASSVVRKQAPALADAAGEIGDPQVRNRGTIGGSIAHADPAADYPAVMLALDADIHVQSVGGARQVNASAFFKDLLTVDLGADEIVTGVSFAAATLSAYAKLHQRASHYALVGVAAALDIRDGKVQSARIGVTGVGPFATRLSGAEKALVGKAPSADTIDAAAKEASVNDVTSDLHASADYRRAMIPVFARRALQAALARAK